jgi:hypothetical protein
MWQRRPAAMDQSVIKMDGDMAPPARVGAHEGQRGTWVNASTTLPNLGYLTTYVHNLPACQPTHLAIPSEKAPFRKSRCFRQPDTVDTRSVEQTDRRTSSRLRSAVGRKGSMVDFVVPIPLKRTWVAETKLTLASHLQDSTSRPTNYTM